jgi:CRP/FNR family cyclic AMP-dependent transcriptional regulator
LHLACHDISLILKESFLGAARSRAIWRNHCACKRSSGHGQYALPLENQRFPVWHAACFFLERVTQRRVNRGEEAVQLSVSESYINSSLANTNSFAGTIPESKQAFSNLKGEAQERFKALGAHLEFSRGDNLFLAGQSSQCVYIVLSGRVKLSVTSREGKTMILRLAEPGDVLGLSAAMDGSDHEINAEAFEFCRVKVIRSKDFVEFLRTYPDAAMEATQCVLREYNYMFKDVCRLGLPTTVAGRLANLLLDWVDTRHQSGHTDSRVMVPLTQEEIAGMTGTSRETVSRVLHQFQREKLISIKGAALTVLQPARLEALAV